MDNFIDVTDLTKLKERVDFRLIHLDESSQESSEEYNLLKFYINHPIVELLSGEYKGLVVVFENIQIEHKESDPAPKLTFEYLLPLSNMDTCQNLKDSEPFNVHINLVLATLITNHLQNA